MTERISKLTAIFVVLLQLAMPAFPAFGRVDFSVSQEAPQTSLEQLKTISSVIVVINSNISEQLRRLIELSCITSRLIQTQAPAQGEDRKNKTTGDSYSPSIVIASSYSMDGQAKSFVLIKDLAGRVFENTLLVCALFAIILFVDRAKWKQYFFLLPRGTTDDIIIMLNSLKLNPHWLHQMRVFSLSENNKNMPATEALAGLPTRQGGIYVH